MTMSLPTLLGSVGGVNDVSAVKVPAVLRLAPKISLLPT
jgi:hypothetical protein